MTSKYFTSKSLELLTTLVNCGLAVTSIIIDWQNTRLNASLLPEPIVHCSVDHAQTSQNLENLQRRSSEGGTSEAYLFLRIQDKVVLFTFLLLLCVLPFHSWLGLSCFMTTCKHRKKWKEQVEHRVAVQLHSGDWLLPSTIYQQRQQQLASLSSSPRYLLMLDWRWRKALTFR